MLTVLSAIFIVDRFGLRRLNAAALAFLPVPPVSLMDLRKGSGGAPGYGTSSRLSAYSRSVVFPHELKSIAKSPNAAAQDGDGWHRIQPFEKRKLIGATDLIDPLGEAHLTSLAQLPRGQGVLDRSAHDQRLLVIKDWRLWPTRDTIVGDQPKINAAPRDQGVRCREPCVHFYDL